MKTLLNAVRESFIPPSLEECSISHPPFKGTPPMRVLILDDSEEFCNIIKAFLNYYHADLTVCHSLKEAVDLFHSGETFDVVIIDYRLTNGSGVEFYRTVVNKWVSSNIVFLTGFVSEQLIKEVSAIGPARVYSKDRLKDRGFIDKLFRQCGIMKTC